MARKKTTKAAADSVKTAAASVSTNTEKSVDAIIIGAFPGTEDLMEAVWRRFLSDGNFRIVSAMGDILTTVASLIEDDSVAEEFVYVPANTIPTAPLSVHELYTPLVYVTRDGKRQFAHRLPHTFTKSFVRSYLDKTDELTSEGLCQAQMEESGLRPVDVGFGFGNYVCPVLRGNPCEHLVLEAFLRKKYVAASEIGFQAIEHLVRRLSGN